MVPGADAEARLIHSWRRRPGWSAGASSRCIRPRAGSSDVTERKNAELVRAWCARPPGRPHGRPDPREHAIVARILAEAAVPVHDFSGKLSCARWPRSRRGAGVFFRVDSAPMHIAAAMGTPVVALLRPEQREGMGSLEGRAPHRHQRPSVPPCGNDGCGGGKVRRGITEVVDRVKSAVYELLSQR